MSTSKHPPIYALILAGGSGERFWPVSRRSRPKQLLSLFDDETLLGKTVDRLEGLLPLENILILTNPVQEAGVRENVPQLPAENIVAEPEKRDTAPAIGLGIALVAARDPDAVMIVLPADHLIQQVDAFRERLATAARLAADSGALVTIGIKPTWPCPGYGYIELGESVADGEASKVAAFREKPDVEQATAYLEAGGYTWNAGMFIWSIPAVMRELDAHCPEISNFVREVGKQEDVAAAADAGFRELPKLSIDYALMEKAGEVWNLEATFDWDDVGGWLSVAKYLDDAGAENASNRPTTTVDASGNIVFSERPTHVALLGVSDLIVVESEDGLLIADKSQADAIKKIVGQLPDELL